MGFFEQSIQEVNDLRSIRQHFETNNEGKYQIINPEENFYRNITISPRFEYEVLMHIVSLYLSDFETYQPPMFLAIEGNAGEGKTSQAIAACVQHGVSAFYISASQLSGSHEGDAVDVMDRLYSDALKRKKSGEKVAIIIDDFHLSNASVDHDVKRTINSVLLTGYLMNLTQHSHDSQIPIIVTGNDFSHVYAPLLRSGRADVFVWSPSYQEKQDVVFNLFKDFFKISQADFHDFYCHFSGACIADFVQLRNDYRKIILKESIEKLGYLDDQAISRINKVYAKQKACKDIRVLFDLAEKRMMSGGVLNG